MGNDALLRLNPACTQELFRKGSHVLVQNRVKEHFDIVTILMTELLRLQISS